ncbi:MAG: acyl-ACP--UDP-N-acetylglucosamine O-acyltransferase [Leptospiraceae bacterium]|nr:acyl-ACP--UDP-N-acetylglucosamine O-acyltransferase [Leptospiraceae bacterium]MDW7975479.1 acyl-ACP--UDP-N-acetylglucosamine O-acyltransferase [Leptospiraceae bacterium]
MKIHPTAIVSPKAEIHENVEIGAYTIIEDDVVIGKNTTIGAYCYIHSGTIIGENNQIFSYANIGGLPQDISFDPKKKTKIVIGNHNIIREYANLHRSTKEEPTRIGDENYIMGSVHIAHDCKIGNRNILVHSSVLAGHVEIGNRAFISGHVGIHQFCRVGDYSIIGGLAKVVQDIPPYMMADGNPAEIVGINIVGLRRANFTEEQKRKIKQAYKILYKSEFSISKALEELKLQFPNDPDIQILIDFIEKSKRGIASSSKTTHAAEF